MGWKPETITSIGIAISEIEAADDTKSLLNALRSFTSTRGFGHIGIGQLINPAELSGTVSEFGATDFPSELIAYWFEQNQIMLDPIVRYALSARNAFTWKSAYESAGRPGRKVLDRGREYGLSSGIAIPIPIPSLPTGLITMSHNKPADLPEEEVGALEIISVHAYTALIEIVGTVPSPRSYNLTARETEIMHYVAVGKSNWETGKILGISEDGVKKHMSNIARKVGAANRAHAVSKVLRSGDVIL